MSDPGLLIRDVLVDTKDGDWGRGEPTEGHSPYLVIRGTDFSSVMEGDWSRVPVRYLPDRTVHRRTLEVDDILIETAGGSPGRPTGRTMLLSRHLIDQTNHPITCASFARFLRVDREIADPRFVYWFLKSLYVSGEIEQYQVQHTGVARFQYTQFAATRSIPLPDRIQQEAVADLLGALDEKIAANRRIIETSDSIANHLVRLSLSRIKTTAISAISSITMGQSPPGESFNESGEGVVFYQGNRDFGFRYPVNRLWTSDPKRMARAGDTLMSVRAPVGALNTATESTCIGRGLASIRSTIGTPSTIFHIFKALPGLWDPYQSGGTVFGSINGKELNALQIPEIIGDRELLEERLASLDLIVASYDAESRTLTELRDSLLPRLMSGELRVRDAEKVVEEVL